MLIYYMRTYQTAVILKVYILGMNIKHAQRQRKYD